MNYKLSEGTIEKSSYIKNKCIECGLCISNCKMLSEYCSSPREMFGEIIGEKSVDKIIPYSCNLCGKCTKVCPCNLDLAEAFKDMRVEIALQNNDKSPVKGHRGVEGHQRFSFSKAFSTTIPGNKKVKRVFMPGCSLTAYSPELVVKTFRFLKERLDGTGIVLMCCGKPTKDLGQNEKFKERYSALQREFDDLGVEEVITACQNCFITIGDSSPSIKVKSLWTVLPELGLPEEAIGIGSGSDIIFSIHDACPTRYNREIHEGIRWAVNELGYKVNESQNSRENTNCCGFGGMVVPGNPKLAEKIINNTVSKLSENHIITYCASCREAMTIGGKKSVHILDLIFGDKLSSSSKFQVHPKSPFQSWLNRYKAKVRLKKSHR